MTVPIVKSPSFSKVNPANILNSLKGPGESRARHGHHAAPLEQLVHAHQRGTEPLPNVLSDDVSRKERMKTIGSVLPLLLCPAHRRRRGSSHRLAAPA